MRRMLSRTSLALSGLCIAAGALLASVPPAIQSGDALGAEGLWRYLSLGKPTGDETKLDGLFVFQSGRFVQQSLNMGEPLTSQVAQAHAGTYTVENGKVKLLAEVGLIVTPPAAKPVASSQNRNHELAVARNADRLVLTFGSGTVQKFKRVGPAAGRILPLSRGALALVDGYFILVFEDALRTVAGSGTYKASATTLRFAPERWLSARDGKVSYSTEPRDATLSSTSLEIAGEAPIKLVAPAK